MELNQRFMLRKIVRIPDDYGGLQIHFEDAGCLWGRIEFVKTEWKPKPFAQCPFPSSTSGQGQRQISQYKLYLRREVELPEAFDLTGDVPKHMAEDKAAMKEGRRRQAKTIMYRPTSQPQVVERHPAYCFLYVEQY